MLAAIVLGVVAVRSSQQKLRMERQGAFPRGHPAALVSVPNLYMHSAVEVVSLTDLDNTAKLLAEALTRIDKKTDFIPR